MNQKSTLLTIANNLEDEAWKLRRRIVELENENATLRDVLNLPKEIAPAFGFTIKENTIFSALMAREIIPRESLFALLYSTHADGGPSSSKIIDVFICNIRRKIRRYGLTLTNRYEVGYFITPADKARIREILATNGARNDCATGTYATRDAAAPATNSPGAGGRSLRPGGPEGHLRDREVQTRT